MRRLLTTARLLRARERGREPDVRYRNSRAKGGKINEAEKDVGLGALPRLLMHKYPIVHVHIYIANMQYIRNYHPAYKYTIQVTHARPTMHRIR